MVLVIEFHVNSESFDDSITKSHGKLNCCHLRILDSIGTWNSDSGLSIVNFFNAEYKRGIQELEISYIT